MSRYIFKFILGMAFLLSLSSLFSCVSYDEVNVTDIRRLDMKEFIGKSILLSAEVEIANPNNYNISVTDSKFEISTGNKLLGNFRIDNKVHIPKSSKEYHELTFKVSLDDLAPGAQKTLLALVLSGKDEIPISVDGFIEAKAFMMKRKFPITFQDRVSLGM